MSGIVVARFYCSTVPRRCAKRYPRGNIGPQDGNSMSAKDNLHQTPDSTSMLGEGLHLRLVTVASYLHINRVSNCLNFISETSDDS